MNIEDFRTLCLNKKGTTEEFPFDKTTLVYKVMGKMYAVTDVTDFNSVTLKCDPEEIPQLKETYDYIVAPPYFDKNHWISVQMDWQVDDSMFKKWVDNSYDLVVAKLTRKVKEELKNL